VWRNFLGVMGRVLFVFLGMLVVGLVFGVLFGVLFGVFYSHF